MAQLFEALRYKPEGRGFDSLGFFMDLILPGSTQPLTEMRTGNSSGTVGEGAKGGRCVGLTT